MGGRRILQFLHVGGDDDRRGGTLGLGGADRPVQDVGQLLRHGHHLDVLARHILEEREQVHFLLIRAAHGAAVGLADDRHHRNVIQFRVVQAVQQVDGAGAGRRHAHADPARELRVADGLEGRHLLVPRLDELRLVLRPSPGGEDAVDAVAGVGEHVMDAPGPQALEQEISNCRSHLLFLPCQMSQPVPPRAPEIR